ncbi:hypothetical protein CTI12_AA019490 [Artemisia annua]|uniref:Transmembrane protein n=1 Tax=Artemisia annua TaxID=35608 RepID=A0A2U1QK96_ARTAN|nr:hypothetical protein CTI12_AA019490 [Artemisia annua]
MAPTIVNHRRLNAIKILNTNSLHFITLSLLFLPLTITIHLHPTSAYVTTILQTLTTLISVILSTLTGVALTTYSTHQAILSKPLTFTSTFKSLSSSFKPLFTTFISGSIKPFFFSLLALWFHFDLFKISCVVAFLILFYSMVLGLAPQIAVLESKYGIQPITESAKLSVRFRFKLFVYASVTGGVIGILLWYCAFLKNKESVSNWMLFVQVGANYLQCSVMVMHYVVSVTVLYMRAKAWHGDGVVVVRSKMEVTDEDMRVLVHGGFSYLMLSFYVVLVISIVIVVIIWKIKFRNFTEIHSTEYQISSVDLHSAVENYCPFYCSSIMQN